MWNQQHCESRHFRLVKVRSPTASVPLQRLLISTCLGAQKGAGPGHWVQRLHREETLGLSLGGAGRVTEESEEKAARQEVWRSEVTQGHLALPRDPPCSLHC